MEPSCIFCKIANGGIDADILYKDDLAFVIKDLSPRAPIHLLIIPMQHLESLENGTQAETFVFGHLVQVCEKMATNHNTSKDGYRIAINQGKNAGQTISHLHLHLLGGGKLGPEG